MFFETLKKSSVDGEAPNILEREDCGLTSLSRSKVTVEVTGERDEIGSHW